MEVGGGEGSIGCGLSCGHEQGRRLMYDVLRVAVSKAKSGTWAKASEVAIQIRVASASGFRQPPTAECSPRSFDVQCYRDKCCKAEPPC